METMEKKEFWKYVARLCVWMFAVLAGLVLLGYVGISFASYFTGFTFFFSTTYGWDAVWTSFVILAIPFMPLLVACVAVEAFAGLYFWNTRGRYEAAKTREVLKFICKKLMIPVIVLILIAGIVLGVGYTLESTYLGAKLRHRFNPNGQYYSICTLNSQIEEEVRLVEKNDETIYLRGFDYEGFDPTEPTEYAFMKQVYYYETGVSPERLAKLVDTSKADHYVFFDMDNITMFDVYYEKESGICYRQWVPEVYYVWRPLE